MRSWRPTSSAPRATRRRIEALAAVGRPAGPLRRRPRHRRRRNERPIGGFGNAEVFSLTPTKPMVAGEGGLVATNDVDLADRLRLGRDYGNPGDYDTRFVGLNARMSEFHAAMALESLDVIDVTLERRRAIARAYMDRLAGVPGIRVQDVAATDVSTYKDFTIAVDAGRVRSDPRPARHRARRAGHRHPELLRPAGPPPAAPTEPARRSCLPVTELTSRSVVSLPIYPDLADRDVELVATTVRLAHEHAEELAAHDDLVIVR